MDGWLFGAGVLDLVSTGFFSVLTWRLSKRAVSPPARLASLALCVFWGGLAAHVATTGTYTIWTSFAPVPTAVAVSLINLQSLLLCIFLWGITAYLYYLVTGRYFLRTFTALYGAYYLLLQYFLVAQFAAYQAASDGEIPILFAAPIPASVAVAVMTAILAPPIGAAVAYLALSRMAPDRTVLFRLALVGTALLLWFGPASYYLRSGAVGTELLIGCQAVALTLIAIAYFPPARLRARLGIGGIEDR